MPPKKDKSSKVDYRELVRKYGIRFKGPELRKNWPEEHRNHFSAIYDIGIMRYEHYVANEKVPKRQIRTVRERVNCLRKRSYELLDDASANEPTWRELEQLILKRFEGGGIW